MQTSISELLLRHLKNKLSDSERMDLDRFIAASQENRQLLDKISNAEDLLKAIKRSSEIDIDAVWQEIKGGPRTENESEIKKETYQPTPKKRLYSNIAGAAALILLAIGIYSLYKLNTEKQIKQVDKQNAITPNYFKASLTTANGDTLHLYDLNPMLFGPETKPVNKDKALVSSFNNNSQHSSMNTLETSKQSYYRLKLPDGSSVWLNCASSLLFPDSFATNERVVYLDGEAYFDVVTNSSWPFRVVAHNADIIVTGTKFNLTAYKKDSVMRTTLLEGGIKLKVQNKTEVLKPGEQALLDKSGELIKTKPRDQKKALAWQRNQFDWEMQPLKTIVDDICHWYGLEPVYKATVHSYPYTATLNRSRPLHEIIMVLELNMPYKFKQEGNFLVILEAD